MDKLKSLITEYWRSVRLQVVNPAEFYAQVKPQATIKAQLMFALTPILIYALGVLLVQLNPLKSIAGFLGAYLAIGIWTIALRFELLWFGENRSFQEILHISTSSASAFALAWVPLAGPMLSACAAAYLCWQGLLHSFKMNPSAAVAAITLPVVLSGVAVWLFSLILFGASVVGATMGR